MDFEILTDDYTRSVFGHRLLVHQQLGVLINLLLATIPVLWAFQIEDVIFFFCFS